MDLLQFQIKESCSLALPEGLKELMSDISREVLRTQPNNIPQFIADYLEALLEVREKLSIACHICNDTCKVLCEPELYNELKAIGLSEDYIDIVTQIIEDHWDQGNVKEQSLLIKLAKKISIDDMQLSSIRNAIQKAIKLHHFKDGVLSGSENKDNKVTDGLHHTLDWYRQNKTTTEEVFMAPNFDPYMSTVSSIDPASYFKLPTYGSENEKEYTSMDYTTASTGKVTFVEEKIIFKSDYAEIKAKISVGNTVYGDDDNNDYKNHVEDYITDDRNVSNDEAELSDNEIEENINNNSHDDSSSSVDEDFITV